MAKFIICPESAFPIGMFSKYIEIASQIIYDQKIYGVGSQYADYDASKIVFNPTIAPNLEDLFDALGITNRCCRMHLISNAPFDKAYK